MYTYLHIVTFQQHVAPTHMQISQGYKIVWLGAGNKVINPTMSQVLWEKLQLTAEPPLEG